MSNLIRITGAYSETIDGIGRTRLGVPFAVESNELYQSLVEQVERFEPTEEPVPAEKKAAVGGDE